jgi:hypothetical protein
MAENPSNQGAQLTNGLTQGGLLVAGGGVW